MNSPQQETTAHISNEQPSVPVQQIIQKFTEHEDEFRRERDNYTYTQDVTMQTLDDDDQPDGEYHLVSDILLPPAGKPCQKDVFGPRSKLQRIHMTGQDSDSTE